MRAITGLFARLRSLWRGLRHRGAIEAEMMEEFRHHMELRTEDLIARGMAPREAARRARLEFGSVERHREDGRASRGLRWLDEVGFSWLDVKLGVRMITKYPALSVVAVIGMSVAIAIGAGAFGAIYSMMDPSLPLEDDERIVMIQTATDHPGNPERRVVHDFLLWRDELKSVADLSAFRTDSRNLITAAGTDLVRVAEMTASGFRVARVAPVLGRPLLPEDERTGAPPVIVIAYEEWQRRFGGEPDIIGRPVRLGSAVHTVVGVMPADYRFPVNHRFWVPLKLNAAHHERGEGPSIEVFGRLAEGSTLESARTEVTAIGRRTAAAYPETHAHLRPQVLRYTHSFFDIDTPAMALVMHALQLAISLLLVVVSVNVAILIYARTATRAGEIAVRSALGASRRRIIVQLFVEAIVLSAIAAAAGLTVAGIGLARTQAFLERAYGDEFPFWFELGLSPGLVLYVAGLTLVAGAIVGVVPALKATGRRVQAGLQQLSSRGSQMQLGRTWTALIVSQVAVAVAVLPFTLYIAGQTIERGTAEPGFAASEILQAWLSIHREESPPGEAAAAYEAEVRTRFLDRTAELIRRLEAEPGIADVTFSHQPPESGRYGRFEVEHAGTGGALANQVAPNFFRVLDVSVAAGRDFQVSDGREGAGAVIVNPVFAERFLGGDVLGRRIRRVTRSAADPETVETGPWLEVVGVVPDFAVQPDFDPSNARVYQAVALADATELTLALRLRGGPSPTSLPRLREITATVDPDLQLHDVRTAADVQREVRQSLLFIALVVAAVTLSVLLLSAAGVHAMMSFTVARRRREIGIRCALGADTRRVLGGIFARAGAQLGTGVLVGLLIAVAIGRGMGGGPFVGRGAILLPVVAGLIFVVGLLAALGPARSVLAVEPTEALREE